MASNFLRLLQSALARRVAYLVVAAVLAWAGFAREAHAQTPETRTRAEAWALCKQTIDAWNSTHPSPPWSPAYCYDQPNPYFPGTGVVSSAQRDVGGLGDWTYGKTCEDGATWNDTTKTCDTPCESRPELGGDSYSNVSADTTICSGSCTFKGSGSCVGVFIDGTEWMGCTSWKPTGATCTAGDSPSAPSDSDGDGSSDGNDGSPNNPGQGGSGQGGAPGQDGSGNPSGGSGSGPGGGQGNGPGEGSGNGNTSGGGGNCSTPPASTGDAILAQIAFQTWATRCAVEKQGKKGEGDDGDKDNSEVPFNEGEEAEDDGEDPGEVPSHSFDLPSMIDMTGFLGGGGSCPDFGSITMGPFGTHSLGGQWFCDWLPVFRALIILMATGTAIKILLGYNA